MYEVRLTQLKADYDRENKKLFSTGVVNEYVLGRFDSETMAEIFKEAIERYHSETIDFERPEFVPTVRIWKVLNEWKRESREENRDNVR